MDLIWTEVDDSIFLRLRVTWQHGSKLLCLALTKLVECQTGKFAICHSV